MKRGGIGLLVIGLMALGGCVDRNAQELAKQTKAIVTDTTIAVKTADVSVKSVPVTMDLTGSIVTDDDVAVSAKVGGRITAVYVKEGDSVQAGQVMARLDSSNAEIQLRQAHAQVLAAQSALNQAMTDARVSPQKSTAAVQASQAALNQAKAALQKLLNGARTEEKAQSKASLDKAKADLDLAKKNLERNKNLFAQGAISRADLDASENQYATALAGYQSALEAYNLVLDSSRPEDIEAAREKVRQAEEQLRADKANKQLDPLLNQKVDAARANLQSAIEAENLARVNLQDLTVKSPSAGKVSGTPIQPGAYAAPGAAVIRLIGSRGVFYEADVPEKDISRVAPGLPVQVTVQALGGITLTGTVASIDPLASDLARLYRVRVRLNENTDKLKPGMFAAGHVTITQMDGVTTIPNNALIRDGEATSVFTVVNGVAKKVSVEVTLPTDSYAVVKGVSPGDKVITDGKSQVVDGSKVTESTGQSASAEAGQEG